jgi:hypothetical protein
LHSSTWPTSTVLARLVGTAHTAHGLPGRPRLARTTTARRGARAHTGARGGAQASTTERPPAGHVGGGDSSPEFLADGEGGKTRLAAAFSDEVRAPAAGGGPASRWRGRGNSAQQSTEKKTARGGWGCSGLCSRGGVHDGGGGRTAAVVRSDNDVVGFGHGRWRDRDGRARGEATARLGQWRGVVGTALPIGAFMAWRRAWQPRGDGVPTGGPGAGNGG